MDNLPVTTLEMDGGLDFSLYERGDAGAILAFEGPLLISQIPAVDKRLRSVDQKLAQIDITGATEMDTVGAWTVHRLAQANEAEIVGAGNEAERLLAAVRNAESHHRIRPEKGRFRETLVEVLGQKVSGAGEGTTNVLSFVGAIIVAFGTLIRHPRRFRLTALVRQMQVVGVSALGIIGLMAFLVGVVIAQQGAVQLQQFGAEIYTVNLTGRLAFRELGVLFAAIMVAGRSGSAFAAQIGTMKLTEEVDAMRTIGVSPIEALVVPRILATTLMMLLLSFYAACIAVVGGAVLSNFVLDIPFMTFIGFVIEVVPAFDLWVGLIKAPVFGLIIAIAGCYQGMQVQGNSEEVGLRTTDAVVQAIFAVIVLDAFFAVFFSQLGWV